MPAAPNQRIRAGCLATADSFDALLDVLKQMQGLGYSGFCTTLRLLQTQTGRIEEVRAQLSVPALDLIGVRASLPRYGEDADRALEEIGRIAMAARQFGARSLIAHSAGLAPDGKFTPEALDAKAKFLDLAAKRCSETGIVFTYRTQDAEFQNDSAELTGLMSKTDVRKVYFSLDLARASKVYPDAVGLFRDHPNRTFAIEAPFGDYPAHELAAAIRHTKWISWLIEAAPAERPRAAIKKQFGV